MGFINQRKRGPHPSKHDFKGIFTRKFEAKFMISFVSKDVISTQGWFFFALVSALENDPQMVRDFHSLPSRYD